MSSWHSYPSIFAMGHAAIADLLLDDVLVEEKVDGSQFSFGRFDGALMVRSKGKVMEAEAPEKLFKRAVEAISQLDLKDGWTYRGECLDKPKHNALCYDRTPHNHVILFDINTDHEQYLTRQEKEAEALRLGLEIVPVMYQGKIEDSKMILEFLERTSCLGGQKIEGVVIKNYSRFGKDKKVLMGKYVSEAFKEVHKKTWGESNPAQNDILIRLITMFKTEARWNKAVIHLDELGQLEHTPRDIGKLIAEVKADIEKDSEAEIKEVLYRWALGHVIRGCASGIPEWYKKKLLESQFREEQTSCLQGSTTTAHNSASAT